MIDEDLETLIIFFFSGESYLERGKIVTNLGFGPFHLENKIDAFCKGASHVTIWAIWDCPRQFKQVEAGVKKEWSEDEDLDSCVPVVSTYACSVNQPLPANSNFVSNLSKHLRVILQRDQGRLDLKEVLINMPEAIGISAFSGTTEDIVLFGQA